MTTYVLRVWVPDRPGALGAVATRIGAVQADVIGIDIIERGAGRAIDDLVIDLPDGDSVETLLAEMNQIEGVDVEDIRELDGAPPDPARQALHVAGLIQRGASLKQQLCRLVEGAQGLIGADWAVVIDLETSALRSFVGEDMPSEKWICAFVAGATTGGVSREHEDIAVTALPDPKLKLVVGRGRLPIRARERCVLEALCALLAE
ncbi:MAG: ACT domain-containing protein [Actinomycetes bacterium]